MLCALQVSIYAALHWRSTARTVQLVLSFSPFRKAVCPFCSHLEHDSETKLSRWLYLYIHRDSNMCTYAFIYIYIYMHGQTLIVYWCHAIWPDPCVDITYDMCIYIYSVHIFLDAGVLFLQAKKGARHSILVLRSTHSKYQTLSGWSPITLLKNLGIRNQQIPVETSPFPCLEWISSWLSFHSQSPAAVHRYQIQILQADVLLMKWMKDLPHPITILSPEESKGNLYGTRPYQPHPETSKVWRQSYVIGEMFPSTNDKAILQFVPGCFEGVPMVE